MTNQTGRRRARPPTLLRLGLAGVVVLAAAMRDDSAWHRYVLPAAVGVIAIDWLRTAVRSRQVRDVAFGAYSALVVAGVLMRHVFDAPRWALVAATIGLVASLLVGFGVTVRDRRRTKELDRLIFSEASSLAFFVMMGAAITYGFVESWLELAAPSPWVFAGIGAAAFIAARSLQRRKYL